MEVLRKERIVIQMIGIQLIGCVFLILALCAAGVWKYAQTPDHFDSVIGTLIHRKTSRNVRSKYRTIPVYTEYTYAYTVNGKTYRFSGAVERAKHALSRKVRIVYLRGFPRCSGVEKCDCSWFAFISGLLFVSGVLFLILPWSFAP